VLRSGVRFGCAVIVSWMLAPIGLGQMSINPIFTAEPSASRYIELKGVQDRQRRRGLAFCMLSREVGGLKKRSHERFSCRVSERSGTAVLYCCGRICFREEAQKFSRAVVQLLGPGKPVVLEFSDVRGIDSAGIGELVLVHMQAQAFECAIRLAALRPQVLGLLELTNVASLFEIYPTVESALASRVVLLA
jgi:anti-anti-sigma factor